MALSRPVTVILINPGEVAFTGDFAGTGKSVQIALQIGSYPGVCASRFAFYHYHDCIFLVMPEIHIYIIFRNKVSELHRGESPGFHSSIVPGASDTQNSAEPVNPTR